MSVFDLSARLANIAKPEEPEKLDGYSIVPKESWSSLKRKLHIRYFTTEGKYRSGGFIYGHGVSPTGDAFIHLTNNLSAFNGGEITRYKNWRVYLNKTSKIYQKIYKKREYTVRSESVPEANLSQSVTADSKDIIKKNFINQQQQINQLEAKITRLEQVINEKNILIEKIKTNVNILVMDYKNRN